ncbi:MAG: ribonuclease HI [Holosporaceae bacterium]|jgi:ribonuclease HI|nr:ribonuclease HI [Holosporaceae bacterium]
MKHVEIYTDGACSGNPGPGGWGALVISEGMEDELCGGEKNTTNNRMELTAVIRALEHLPESCSVTLYTDSAYVKNGVVIWIHNWMKNGWQNSRKEPVKNQDLWLRLLEISAKHTVSWNWVKGHAGNRFNERADQLAKARCKPEPA